MHRTCGRITSVLTLSLAASLCSCATTGYQRASLARSEVVEAKEVTVKAHQELLVVVGAVHVLTAPDTTDLQKPYLSFAAAVKGLQIHVRQLADRVEAIRKRSNDYVAVWQKELAAFQSPDIRQRSAERRTEVMESFRKLDSEYQVCGRAMRSLLVELKDLRLYLSLDLTPAGVASAQEQAGRVSAQAVEAGKQLQSFLADLDRVADEMSPVKPAAERVVQPKGPAPAVQSQRK